MFGPKKDDVLPTFTASGSPHVAESRPNLKPKGFKLTQKTLFFLFFAFLAVIIFVLGMLHSRSSSYTYTLECDAMHCVYSKTSGGETHTYEFTRGDILSADMTRIDVSDNGAIVDTQGMTRRASRQFGYSYALKVMLDGMETTLPMSHSSLGRRSASTKSKTVNEYRTQKIDELDLKESQFLSLLGIVAIIVSSIFLLFSCVLMNDKSTKKGGKRRVRKNK